MANYKYQSDIDEFSNTCQCPETEYFVFKEKTAFRFVFEDANHPNNFTPPYKIKPKRFLDKSDLEKCQNLGLSLYSEKDKAIQAFNNLALTFTNIKKNIGTHISEGKICDTDGHITEDDEITHFDIYEFENTNIGLKFNTIQEL